MKCKINRRDLLKALKVLKPIATKKGVYPLLENVHMSIEDGSLYLKTTDLKTYAQYKVHVNYVEVEEAGELLVNIFDLHDVVKDIEGTIILEQGGFSVTVATTHGKNVMRGEDPQKFPIFSDICDYSIEMLGVDIQDMIKRTIFVTTTEKTRYDLDSVLVEIGDNIRFVATDGKRLAICDKEISKLGDVNRNSCTIPAAGIKQIFVMLKSLKPERVKLGFLDDSIHIVADNVRISTRVSEAKFPPYRKVISDLPDKANMLLKDFTSLVKRAGVKELAYLSFKRGFLSLYNSSSEMMMPCDSTIDLDIVLDPRYLQDVVKVLKDKQVSIRMEDNQSPIEIIEGGFRYILLPIKIKDIGKWKDK